MSSLSVGLSTLLQSGLSTNYTPSANTTATVLSTLLGTQSSSDATASTALEDPTQISQVGQFLNNLQTLKESNPSEFKTLLTSISSQLTSAASQAGSNTSQGEYLTQLAGQFQSVADGGSLSQLLPQTPTAQSLATQAYLQVQQSASDSLLQILNGGSSDSSSTSNSLQSLLSSGGSTSSATDPLQSLISALSGDTSTSGTAASRSSSSSSSSSATLQSIFQQVQQAVSGTTTST